jgi:hypothetical protein
MFKVEDNIKMNPEENGPILFEIGGIELLALMKGNEFIHQLVQCRPRFHQVTIRVNLALCSSSLRNIF